MMKASKSQERESPAIVALSGSDTEEEVLQPPPYALRDHCQYLKLRTEHTDTQSYWYCDWTSHFVSTSYSCSNISNISNSNSSSNSSKSSSRPQQHANTVAMIKDVVKDYCQPFRTLAELQDTHVGISCLSPHTEDPLAVRTVSIRLRPDAHQYKILQAVHQAFTALHINAYHIVASTSQTFQAIGANGSIPYFVSAVCAVHTQTLERQLWIRFYHVESVPFLCEQPDESSSTSSSTTTSSTTTTT
jgi:hypothetical protein